MMECNKLEAGCLYGGGQGQRGHSLRGIPHSLRGIPHREAAILGILSGNMDTCDDLVVEIVDAEVEKVRILRYRHTRLQFFSRLPKELKLTTLNRKNGKT